MRTLLGVSLILCNAPRIAVSYPLISEVDVGVSRCLSYVIPPHDEAHMVFVAIKPAMADTVEDYFVNLVWNLTKQAGKEPTKRPTVPEIPSEINNSLADASREDDAVRGQEAKTGMPTNVHLQIRVPGRGTLKLGSDSTLLYNRPIILQNIRQSAQQIDGIGRENDMFEVCFINKNSWKRPHDVDIIFDTILQNAVDDDDAEVAAMKRKVVRKEHITPLEEQLDESIERAEDILDEFKYMEKRERRMRKTADSTNARIRSFSYISIAILLAVTWLQVTYLKGYFRKKKLM